MGLLRASTDFPQIFVFDLDGVVYRGSELQPHSVETIRSLRESSALVRFFTNNSTLSRQAYVEKLAAMNIPASVDDIMTSSYATALYLTEHDAAGKTVYKIGEDGISDELSAVGMRVISGDDDPGRRIDYVVVGLDRDFHYRKLARAMNAILNGAEFIATNADATFPLEGDILVPGGGCMVSALVTATGREPILIGKPETYALKKIIELAGGSADNTVMVGDRLDTDVQVANRAGVHSVLVLTGITSPAEAEAACGELCPDRVIRDLGELLT
jgi:4-nitrophenyl phosphatase